MNNNLSYEINSQNITDPINPSLSTSNGYNLATTNIAIRSSFLGDVLKKKYRTEMEIVPVEETEYIPLKKFKYVKRIKVYMPTVKK